MVQSENSQRIFFISLFTLYLVFFFFPCWAQAADHIDFDNLKMDQEIDPGNRSILIIAEVRPAAVIPGEELTLRIIGRTESGYHLYSIRKQGEYAPDPTKIVVKNPFLTSSSEMKESPTVLVIDEAFEMSLQVHKGDFWISRSFLMNKMTPPGSYRISGYLLYQVCSSRICSLPLKKRFNTEIIVNKP